MNKSKFLKKSLAALLAIMMVVAMIPLSAAAADAEVTMVTIGDYRATGGPTNWNIEINGTEAAQDPITVRVVLGNHSGLVRHYDENSENDAQQDENNNNIWYFPMTKLERRNGTVNFSVFDGAGSTGTQQDMTLTYTVKEDSNDVSVKTVERRDEKGGPETQYGLYEIDPEDPDRYILTLPYGTKNLVDTDGDGEADATAIYVVPNSDTATVRYGDVDNEGFFGDGVEAVKQDDGSWIIYTHIYDDEKNDDVDLYGTSLIRFDVINGSSVHNYTVKTVNATGFASFSVEGERKSAQIDRQNRVITVFMPYGSNADADGKFEITPNFTMVYPSAKVIKPADLTSGEAIQLYEGVTASNCGANKTNGDVIGNYKDIDTAEFTVTVKYSDEKDDQENWTVVFDVPEYDPDPTLKGIRLGNFEAEISEETHIATLKLPARLRTSKNNQLEGLASPGAKVLVVDAKTGEEQIVAQGIPTDEGNLAHTTGVYQYLADTNEDNLAVTNQNPTTGNPVVGGAANTNGGTIDLKNNDWYYIRVIAAGDAGYTDADDEGIWSDDDADKAKQDYLLNIETVETQDYPKITSMVLENPKGDKYEAEITANTVLFNLPYSVYNRNELAGWKVYYSLNDGSTIAQPGPSALDKNVPVGGLYRVTSGSKITTAAVDNGMGDGGKVAPAYDIFPAAEADNSKNNFDGQVHDDSLIIEVENERGYTDYRVAIKQGAPSLASSLSNFKLTTATTTKGIVNGQNTFAATVKGNDLTVEIPYSQYKYFLNNSHIVADLPDGARVFYADSLSEYLTENSKLADQTKSNDGLTVDDTSDYTGLGVLDANDEDSTVNADKKLPLITGLNGNDIVGNAGFGGLGYDGFDFDENGKINKLVLVVVSEKAATNAVTGNPRIDKDTTYGGTGNALTTGEFTTYTLTVKRAAPSRLAVLDSFSVYDRVTGTNIPAVIDGSKKRINLTLPASFIADNRVATGVNGPERLEKGLFRDLVYTFGVSHFEGLEAWNTGVNLEDLSQGKRIKEINVDSYAGMWDEDGKVVSTWVPNDPVTKAVNDKGEGQLYIDGTQETDKSDPDNIVYGNEFNHILVKSEEYIVNGGNGAAADYEIFVTYEAPRKGAELKSVTINGVTARPVGDKVTVNLPMGAEKTGLKPTFEISEYAYMTNDNEPVSEVTNKNWLKSGTLMNFTFPRTVAVLNEEGLIKQTYQIEVKVNDGFTDVKEGDWFYNYVTEAANRGFIVGTGDGKFDPNGQLTRAAFATMIARVDGWDQDAEYTNPFTDMDSVPSEIMVKAVAYCADKGYITGSGDTTFRPNDPITRQEMAIIISRVMKLNTTDVNIVTRFSDDASIADWAKNYVYACVNANMLLGTGDNTFNPLGITDRASAATVAIRVANAK